MSGSGGNHPHISLAHQAAAAAGASVVSAVVVNPLDVAKVCSSCRCCCFTSLEREHVLISVTVFYFPYGTLYVDKNTGTADFTQHFRCSS